MLRSVGLLALLLIPAGVLVAADVLPEKMLYDFEDDADLKAWANLELPEAKDKEPPAKFERSGDHATSGKHSLKLTFSGGLWPTITTTQVSPDWLTFKTFKADVFASRYCVVGFTLLQEKSVRGDGWDPSISRWTKTVFLKPGKNEIIATLAAPNDYAVHAKWGKPVRFEIFMYSPRDGESVYVDNLRLGNDKPTPETPAKIAIAGTDWTVSGVRSSDACRELGKNVAHFWSKPPALTVEQVEESMQTKLVEARKRFPKAVLAVLRDGEKGFDPAKPEQAYAGWKDAYWNSHGPDTAFAERARNRGKSASQEVFMRHRSPLMRVDFSSIPAGSNVLAAQLMIVRVSERTGDENNPDKRANMWVVEPCNRPWEEHEVNAFEYARDKFWKEIGGFQMGGEDPDFLPVFLAWGPGRPGKVNAWDFTQAVKYWTDGKHANHGFMLHGDSGDYMTAHTREAAEIKHRPAVFVIYVPK